jgi:hypothetical protein
MDPLADAVCCAAKWLKSSSTSFSEIASFRKWSGGGIGHPCQRTQNDGGGIEVLHPLSVWNKQE